MQVAVLQTAVFSIKYFIQNKRKRQIITELYCYDHFALLRPATVWLEKIFKNTPVD